jgi:hypothetical protein
VAERNFQREWLTFVYVSSIPQTLARFLDRPHFPWKTVLAGFSLGQFILEGLLSTRQYKVLQRTKAPKVLEGEVSQKVFDESQVRFPIFFPLELVFFFFFFCRVLSKRSEVVLF